MSKEIEDGGPAPKWYIDAVTTAGATIAADGLFIGKIIDEHLAETIVTAVNSNASLLACKEALTAIDAVAIDFGHLESAARTMQEIARSALSSIRDGGKGE